MQFNVTKQQRVWWSISAVAILISIVAMIISWVSIQAPIRPSLDFVGGTRLQLELDCSIPNNCDQPIDVSKVREILTAQNLASSSIQVIGEKKQGLSIKTNNLDVQNRTNLQDALTKGIGTFDPKTISIDSVGPAIGRELFSSGLLALIISFVGIILYLTFRFQFDYAFFAIVALFHDVVVTAGLFAILGLIAGVEVDSLFLVSLLTIIGFSVNDTVVIYDRIRENMQLNPESPIEEIVDSSVSQTLTRSINTTLTTLLPLIAIFLFGGETLKFFALALIFGFVSGAYSSIFVASTLLGWWRKSQESKVKSQKSGVSDSV